MLRQRARGRKYISRSSEGSGSRAEKWCKKSKQSQLQHSNTASTCLQQIRHLPQSMLAITQWQWLRNCLSDSVSQPRVKSPRVVTRENVRFPHTGRKHQRKHLAVPSCRLDIDRTLSIAPFSYEELDAERESCQLSDYKTPYDNASMF